MPDIFDTLEEEPASEKRDVFDDIESETPTPRADYVNPPPRPDDPPFPRTTDAEWAQIEADYRAKENQPYKREPLGKVLREGFEMGMEEVGAGPLGLPAKALALVPKPTAQQVQDALDVIGNPSEMSKPSRPPSEAAKAIAGTVGVGRGVAESLASPLGVATLGAGGLPGLAPKAVSAAFLADILHSVPEQARRAGEASVTGDTQEKVEAYGGLGITPLMAGAIAAHVAAPIPPRIIENIAKADAIGLNKSAQALADTVKRKQSSDQVQQLEKPITAEGVKDASNQPEAATVGRSATVQGDLRTLSIEAQQAASQTSPAAQPTFGRRSGVAPFFDRESELGDLVRSSLPPTVGDVRASRSAAQPVEQPAGLVDTLEGRRQVGRNLEKWGTNFTPEEAARIRSQATPLVFSYKRLAQLLKGEPLSEGEIGLLKSGKYSAPEELLKARPDLFPESEQAPFRKRGPTETLTEYVTAKREALGDTRPAYEQSIEELQKLTDRNRSKMVKAKNDGNESAYNFYKAGVIKGEEWIRYQQANPRPLLEAPVAFAKTEMQKPSPIVRVDSNSLFKDRGNDSSAGRMMREQFGDDWKDGKYIFVKDYGLELRIDKPERNHPADIQYAKDVAELVKQNKPLDFNQTKQIRSFFNRQSEAQGLGEPSTAPGVFEVRQKRAEDARAQGGEAAQVLLRPEDALPAPEKLPNRNPLVQVVGPVAQQAAKAQPELPGTYAAGAKVIADKLRAQFKTETGGKAFIGPVEIINVAVEVAAKIIEYGGSAADALAAGLKHIRQYSPADEAAFRSRFDDAFKAATPKQERATLDDVYGIFEPAPKESKGITTRVGETVESFRTGFSSKFRPLNKLAEDIAAKVGGKARDIAGIFEQLKGSSGKAEADVYRFDKDVSDRVKGSERDFNAYVFLRRSLDRLQQDAADIARAQAGEDVPNLNRRRVSQYTIPQLEAKLNALSEQIGGEKLAQFTKAAEVFQTHMDQALRLQVESGRMSPEVYDAIKAGNQFYAPFKVMKYIEDTMRPEGSGRKVDTTADYVKAMEGIEDPNFKLGDMLAAARQNLTLSRTLAEKNRAMQNITELAALDVDGNFVQKLKSGQDAPRGMEAVNVMENGVRERYAVNPDVAHAIQNSGPGLPAGIVARWSSNLFRAGATTLNLAFQPVNLLMADAPRAALVSKYGVKGVTDLVRYPMDFVESLFSSIAGDVFGVKNKLFQDFLDSGAAGTTVQQYLTPEALKFQPASATSKTQAIAKTILNTIPQFANAIEQASKVLGVKRAMRLEGVKSGAALAKQIPEAITEIRRFSGSPDFGRAGKWTEQYRLNLIYMFLNARIQGAVADVGRLTGRDGGSRAAKTWLKMGTAVGIPTAYLYMLNNSDEYKEDYAKRPEQEKQNYWLIPKDTFITGANGEKMRDYWRVPKREIAQWMGNAVESGLDFANQRDPDAFWKWAGGMAESIAPVNIRGNTLQERGESVLSGTHPFIKAPIETATGRDLYRHRAIVPELQKKASPEEQYTERTAEVFKSLAEAMPDMAPEALRSPLMLENVTKNFTAGLLTQFLPRQPVEGRGKAENLPLTQRFQALPYTDSSEFDQRIQRFERESADEQLKRMRDAKAIMDSNKGAKPDVLIKQMIEKHGRDPKMAERIVDLYLAEQRGITSQERRVLALPVTQRAEYLADELKGKTPEQKTALLRNWSLKRVLTDRVAQELAPLIKPTPNPNP